MRINLHSRSSYKKNFIHTVAALLINIIGFNNVNAQKALWTWVSGDSTQFNDAVYGTRGIPDAANKPGSRDEQSEWIDAYGNVWIFGGWGADGSYTLYNDLWKYTTATGQWTWVSGDNAPNTPGVYGVKGVPDARNKPGARYGSASWTDAAGNFWIFGGAGWGFLNDLWMFNPSTGLWTWVSGSDVFSYGVYGTRGKPSAMTMPHPRRESAGWADANGDFWIFGGEGQPNHSLSGAMNDLWMYNPYSGEWVWVSGDSTIEKPGVYGTRGIPDAANKPASRELTSGWADGSGNCWIFGGAGDEWGDSVYNDLWKYNIGTGQWTWVSGDNTANKSGVYGTKGAGAATNKPGARYGLSEMTDANGNFWFFGGEAPGTFGSHSLNDLWAYTPSTGIWTWVSGDQTTNSAGVYGTKGQGAATNKPGGRAIYSGGIDGTGNLWIFGGFPAFNDLWKCNISYALPVTRIRTDVDRNTIIRGVTGNSSINVYPNPTGANLVLQTNDNSLLNTPVKLYDAGGRLLKELRITSPQQIIDLHNVPNGVLWLQLSNGKVFTVVKER